MSGVETSRTRFDPGSFRVVVDDTNVGYLGKVDVMKGGCHAPDGLLVGRIDVLLSDGHLRCHVLETDRSGQFYEDAKRHSASLCPEQPMVLTLGQIGYFRTHLPKVTR